jgi:hypothetical protein
MVSNPFFTVTNPAASIDRSTRPAANLPRVDAVRFIAGPGRGVIPADLIPARSENVELRFSN